VLPNVGLTVGLSAGLTGLHSFDLTYITYHLSWSDAVQWKIKKQHNDIKVKAVYKIMK
jgi:hypothetical protein